MTTLAQLRKAALALPEVEETAHFGMVAFTVRGTGFASVTKDRAVQLNLAEPDLDAALADLPAGEQILRGGRPIGLRIPLADINGMALNHLVRRAWFARAPKRLAASVAAADAAAPGAGGDLPTAIGAPATRALAGAGITTLVQVAEFSETELLALHGVGPRALRILADELQRRGLTLG
ncbi:hypothetical protein OCAE111667_22850 [Occultella aeris]|uniref:DNA-binding protein n=1 Tax=Occultella aeris TaxID=2761496 RepID=A0A7M4DSI8_9MICO|nr:hypothetical protein [Occultella aeris]VZO40432.1 hypothetical protein HALOF300_05136 [Occultella aeris]